MDLCFNSVEQTIIFIIFLFTTFICLLASTQPRKTHIGFRKASLCIVGAQLEAPLDPQLEAPLIY